jgi:[protein-PII] uridylyltransferase
MFDYLLKQKETDNKNLSKEFDDWLFRDRGRQVKGIKYFLNKRSGNIDRLVIDAAGESNLNTINNFGIFTVGGYGRGELHPYSDIDLLLLSKVNLSRADQKKVETFISLLWDLGLDIGHSVRTLDQAISRERRCLHNDQYARK